MNPSAMPPLPAAVHPEPPKRLFVLACLKWLGLALPFIIALVFIATFINPKYQHMLSEAGFQPQGAAALPGAVARWLMNYWAVLGGGAAAISILLCTWLDRRIHRRMTRSIVHTLIAGAGYGLQLAVLGLVVWQMCLFALATTFVSSLDLDIAESFGLTLPQRQLLHFHKLPRWIRLDSNAAPLPELSSQERKRQLIAHLEPLERRLPDRYHYTVLFPFESGRDEILADGDLQSRVLAVASRFADRPINTWDELTAYIQSVRKVKPDAPKEAKRTP